MEVTALAVFTLGAICGIAAIVGGNLSLMGGVKFGPVTRGPRVGLGMFALFLILVSAIAGVVTLTSPSQADPLPSPGTSSPETTPTTEPSPEPVTTTEPAALSGPDLLAAVADRCDARLAGFAVSPDATTTDHRVVAEFWNGYAEALRGLSGEIAGASVTPDTVVTALQLQTALEDRAASADDVATAAWSLDRDGFAAAAVVGNAREGDLDALLTALGLARCAGY